MSFLICGTSFVRKKFLYKEFCIIPLPPEVTGGRYNLLLIAVNQILYHRFICLLLKLHDLLLCHISRTGFILAGQWWKHFIFIIYRRPGSPFAGCHVHQRESYQIAQRYRIGQFFTFVVGPHS